MIKQHLLAVVSVTSALLLAGCGGGGGGSSSSGGATQLANTNPTSLPTSPDAPAPVLASVQLAPANPVIAIGQAVALSALGLDASGQPSPHQVTYTWSSSNTNVVTIAANPSGEYYTRLVTGVAAGTSTITAKDNISGISGSAVVTVAAASAGPGQPPGAAPAPGGGPAPTSGGGPVSNPGPTPVPPVTITQPTSVYFNDFQTVIDSAWTFNDAPYTQIATAPSGQRYLGEFPAGKATLSLANLPPHNSLTVSFKLYMIRSMDGNSSIAGPDLFDVTVNGLNQPLLHTTFSNIDGKLGAFVGFYNGFSQAFPDNFAGPDVLQHPFHTGASAINSLGYTFIGIPTDATYTLTYTFNHTSDTATINWISKQDQGPEDESWGLDDVQVVANP